MPFILIVLSLLLFSSDLYAKKPSTILRDLDSLELEIDQKFVLDHLDIQALGSRKCSNEFLDIINNSRLNECLENTQIEFLNTIRIFQTKTVKKYDLLLSKVTRNSEIAIIILTKKVMFLRSLTLIKDTYQ